MTPNHRSGSTPRKSISYRGRTFSNSCLSCEDLTNCCGSSTKTDFDGAAPTKKLGLSRRDALKLLGGVSAALAAAPFIAAGSYLIPQVSQKFEPTLIANTDRCSCKWINNFLVPLHDGPHLHEYADTLAARSGAASG